jgi:hypothetical protein
MATAKREDTDALALMRRRYSRADENCKVLFDKARDDIKFVAIPGNQWDNKLKSRRGDRPTYEFPKLSGHVRQVINEMRQSRPQGKVRGAEESDAALAELMQGICRNIESTSNAELAYDIAFEPAVQGGYGVWRICTDYLRDDDFDQDIRIKPIENPFSAKWDPAAIERNKRDGHFWFVEELVPEETFEKDYPDADMEGFFSDGNCAKWREAGQVKVCEYWYKEPLSRELWALSSGAVVFADEAGLTEEELAEAGLTITRRRTVESHKVMMRLTNGHQFLTEPYEFPSKYIPIIPVWGNYQNVDGEEHWQGMVRPNKDQQRLHNVHRTAAIEAVAKSPKAPFIVKLKWIKGLTNYWNRANSEDFPYLPINDEADDIPKRTQQAEIPAALLQLAAMDNEDIKASTGQYDASLGARSNETSGVAIGQRKMQSATATFNYIDNLAYAIKFSTEILVDMIPRVYDTPRVVRTLGPDGGERWKQLYQEVIHPVTKQRVVLNDIKKGKYDVVTTVGPTYATQRMEAVDAFSNMVGQMGASLPPPIATLMAYTVVKNMDLPGSDDVNDAFRKMLVAQDMLPPADGDAPPQPPQPPPLSPKEIADAEKSAAQALLYGAQAEGQQIENAASAAILQMQPPLPAQPVMQPPPPEGGFFMPETAIPPGI